MNAFDKTIRFAVFLGGFFLVLLVPHPLNAQCKFPWPPPPSVGTSRAPVWTAGAPEKNIQDSPLFTLQKLGDSANGIGISDGQLQFKGASFVPVAQLGLPIDVYEGFFDESSIEQNTEWVMAVNPTDPTKLLFLNLLRCESRFIRVKPIQIDRVVWKGRASVTVCDSMRSTFAQIDIARAYISEGVLLQKHNVCGYYVPLPLKSVQLPTKDLVPIKVGNEYGYSDDKKKLVVQPKYKSASPFSEGLAPVYRNNRCGYIDYDGTEIIPLTYESCFEFSSGLAKVQRKGTASAEGWMFIDRSNAVVDYINNAYQSFRDGFSVEIFQRSAKAPNGRRVLELAVGYNFVSSFSEGLACVGGGNGQYYKEGNGFVNRNGKIVFWMPYSCHYDFSGGLASVSKPTSNGVKYAYVDKKGGLSIPFLFSEAYPFSGSSAVVKMDGLWKMIDKSGRVNKVLDFDFVDPPQGGIYPVKKNDRWGLIDYTGALVVPLKYDRLGFFGGLPEVTKDGKSFFIDRHGTEYFVP